MHLSRNVCRNYSAFMWQRITANSECEKCCNMFKTFNSEQRWKQKRKQSIYLHKLFLCVFNQPRSKNMIFHPLSKDMRLIFSMPHKNPANNLSHKCVLYLDWGGCVSKCDWMFVEMGFELWLNIFSSTPSVYIWGKGKQMHTRECSKRNCARQK